MLRAMDPVGRTIQVVKNDGVGETILRIETSRNIPST
jgi:hypothetical protein